MRSKEMKWAGGVLVAAAVSMLLIGQSENDAPSRHWDKGAAATVAAVAKPRDLTTPPAQRRLLAGNPWDSQDQNSTSVAGNDSAVQSPRAAAALAAGRRQMTPQDAALLDSPRISPRLAAMARAHGERMIEVFVQHSQQPGGAEQARVEALGGQVLRSYENFPYLAVRIPANKIGHLALAGDVSFLDFNARVFSASSSARQTAGVPYSGSGTSFPVSSTIGVAVVDSGVAVHPDLNVVSRAVFNDARTGFEGSLYDGFYDGNYRESYGSDSWSATPWVERGDDGKEASGKIRILSGLCPYDYQDQCLEISANSTTTTSVERSMNLTGAREAYLGFDLQLRNVSSTAGFAIEISNNGGSTWSTLYTLTVPQSNYFSFDVSPYVSSKTKFRVRVADTDPTAVMTVDNVSVWFRNSTYFRDDFETYTYNGASWGNEAWAGPWTETGDGTTSPSAGTIYIGSYSLCPNQGSACLRIDAGGGVGDAITRPLNLAGVFGAMLKFDYRMVADATAGTIVVEASKDSGSSWTQLGSFNSNSQNWDVRYDLTRFATANARIRFRVTNAVAGTVLRLDNLEVHVERGNPDDELGHGTHIAGIIGGNGGSSGLQPGVARGARIHQVRVLDGRGRGTVADLIAGLDWIYSNGASQGIKIVNMSLGTGVTQSVATDPLVQASERLWDAGFVVIASAGNYGVFGNMTITSPGNARKVITVGSLTDNGTASNFADDYVSTYSSRGPTLIDHVLKPDLIAPGNRYVATVPADSRLRAMYPERVFNCGSTCTTSYLEMSGTSMAAAQVSGAVLLMLTKEPTLNPSTVKARLMRSARKISGSDPTATGAGVLSVQAALNDTGYVYAAALSPKMARSTEGSAILVENTGYLWNNTAFGAGYLWQNGYLWSNNYSSASGYLWSDGYLWQNGYLWSNGYLWNNGYLWQNGYLWSNGYLWEDAVDGVDGLAGASASSFELLPD